MRIAGEGLLYSVVPFVFGAVFLLVQHWISGVLFFLISFLVLLFFRHPDRTVNAADSKMVYAPCDGRVICVRDEKEDNFFNSVVQRVGIFMSVFNVHINYAPLDGTVEYVKYSPGNFVNAGVIELCESNENNFIGINNGRTKVGVRQVAGWIARRIVCDCKKGDNLLAGKRFGLIRFGSRVDVFIPKDYTIQVKVGDVVRAGRTIIGGIK